MGAKELILSIYVRYKRMLINQEKEDSTCFEVMQYTFQYQQL